MWYRVSKLPPAPNIKVQNDAEIRNRHATEINVNINKINTDG